MDVTEPANAVLPPGTAAVLRALAGTEAVLTVRQLARVAGVSHNRAGQVVQRLTEHGLVLAERAGPSMLCRLNRQHLAADAVIELVRLRARMLELLRHEIASWPVAVEHASLFGSAARGDGDTSSDLDILVVQPTQSIADGIEWEEQLFASGRRIHAATGNHVAWFDISRDDLRRSVQASESIIDEWRRDAIHLAGTELRRLLGTIS